PICRPLRFRAGRLSDFRPGRDHSRSQPYRGRNVRSRKGEVHWKAVFPFRREREQGSVPSPPESGLPAPKPPAERDQNQKERPEESGKRLVLRGTGEHPFGGAAGGGPVPNGSQRRLGAQAGRRSAAAPGGGVGKGRPDQGRVPRRPLA